MDLPAGSGNVSQAHTPSAVLHPIDGGVYVVDDGWRMASMSRAAAEMLGVDRHGVIGLDLFELFPELVHAGIDASFRRARSTGVPIELSAFLDSTKRWASVRAEPFEDGLAVTMHGITPARQAGERFRAALDGSPDGVVILEPVRDADGHLLDMRCWEVNAAAAAMLGRSREFLLNSGVRAAMGERGAGFVEQCDRAMSSGETIEEDVNVGSAPGVAATWLWRLIVPLEGGVAVSLRDVSARKEAEQASLRPAATAVTFDDRAKGHGSDRARRDSAEDIEILSESERAKALRALRALAGAVDAKGAGAQVHSENVANLAVAMARRLGWSDERAEQIREAGLLHDVGKIAVPDRIIAEPGPLTPDEYELMKQHSAIGARIAAGVLTEEQCGWVRHHHERVDGTGYPDRLTAGEISQGALILGAADAYDDMAGARDYGPTRTSEEAVEVCRESVGTQFTEEVVLALSDVALAPQGTG